MAKKSKTKTVTEDTKSASQTTAKAPKDKKDETKQVIGKKTKQEKVPKVVKQVESADDENEEDETQLKSEVENFVKNFNYDTGSDISEPEGLDEIEDE
jgi:hypothetical protein